MKIEDIEGKLREELTKRGLELVWKPDLNRLKPGDFIVFGAEQKPDGGPQLISGFAKGGNSPNAMLQVWKDQFVEALEAVGIMRMALNEPCYVRTGRGKIWPTFVARLKQEMFAQL